MRPFALLLSVLAAGCGTVGGSAVRTGPVALPSYTGDVAIYQVQRPPADAVELGVVEVHGVHYEATVGELLPAFARKVASIGGNIAVVDGVRARFDRVARNQVETFYYTCGLRYTCAGTRVYTLNDEIMTVSMYGRAMTTRGPKPAAPPASTSPAAPPTSTSPAAPPASAEEAPP
jgi:hypothetical protein